MGDNKAFRAKVDSQGRVVIPAAARDSLGIEPGDSLSLVLRRGELRLLTLRQAVKNAQAIARRHSEGRTGLVDEFLRERRSDSGE
jgi:AbrB family looped-hinge helix DNA binding protein